MTGDKWVGSGGGLISELGGQFMGTSDTQGMGFVSL